MSACVIKGCTSKSLPRSSLRFYSFPGNPARRQLWLSKVQLKGQLTAGAVVCGLHFRPEDYDGFSRLRAEAVPQAATIEAAQNYEEANWEPSDTLKVCRICLATDRKMFELQNRSLQQAYCDVTGLTEKGNQVLEDGLPRALCWECAARARAAARLRARALRARDLLARLLCADGAITMNGIRSVNRTRNNLESELKQRHIKLYDYEYVSSKVEDDEEMFVCKLPECIDDNNDDFNDYDIKMDPIDEDKVIRTGFHETSQYNESEAEDRKDVIVMDFNEINVNNEVNSEIKDKEGFVGDIVKVIEVKDIVKGKQSDGNNIKKNVMKRPVKRKRVERAKEERPAVKKEKCKKVQPSRPKYLDEFTITNVTIEEEIAEVQKRKESRAYKRAPYKCDICYRSHIVREKYEAHMLKHTEKYGDYECVVCKTRYHKERFMRHHMKELHTEKYTCKKCPFVTRIKTVASNHVKYHEGTRYQCPHCPKEFDRTTTYYGHLRVKHACDFVCEFCGHTFLSRRGVLRHKSSIHKFDMDTTPLAGPRCDACAATFATEEAHARHLRMSSRHNKGPSIQNDYRPAPAKQQRERKKREFDRPGTPITCEQCNTTLPSRTAYAYHFRKEHRGVARTQHPVRFPCIYMCEQCGRKFQSMSMLKNHQPVHTGVRGFACGVCGKAFVTQMTLYAHARLHRAGRPTFACSQCGKAFSTQSNRDRHMFTHTGLKPCECAACGKRFATAAEARSHVDHVHNKKPWPRRLRRRRAPTEH